VSMHTARAQRQFPPLMRFVHRLTAGLVLAMLGVAVTMVPSLAGYHRLVSIHRPLGILILIVVAIRFVTRQFSRMPPFPATMSPRERSIASTSELLLYMLLVLIAFLLFLTFLAHLGAVLFHTLVVRDGMFSRMAP
jgi:cytochrome b561